LVSPRAAGEIAQLSGYLVGIEADYYMPCGQAATRFTSFSAARIDLTGLLTSGFSPSLAAQRALSAELGERCSDCGLAGPQFAEGRR